MVQDIILRASWKAIWEAPDHPPPPRSSLKHWAPVAHCPAPLHVFWLLTSLRMLPSQSLSPPMTGEGQRRK